MWKAYLLAAAAFVVLAPWPRAAQAQVIVMSGNPLTLTISQATAGQPPTAVSNSTTTYNVTALSNNSRITARLLAPLPAGVTLTLTLQAPAGATSMGPVVLTTSDQNVVQNISAGTHNNLQVTYKLAATTGAGVVSSASRNVLFSLWAL